MKRVFFVFMMLMFFSCADYINKPKNKIEEDIMAEVIADLSVSEQDILSRQNVNVSKEMQAIFKKYKISNQQFVENYKYYVMKKKMNKILEKAQEIIMLKHPKAEEFIRKEIEKNNSINEPTSK